METKSIGTRRLEVPLTEAELLAESEAMCAANDRYNKAEASAKSAKDQYKAEMSSAEEDYAFHKTLFRAKKRTAPVECTAAYDYAAGTVTVNRNDTGETIEVRPIRPEERQSELPDTTGMADIVTSEVKAELDTEDREDADFVLACGRDGTVIVDAKSPTAKRLKASGIIESTGNKVAAGMKEWQLTEVKGTAAFAALTPIAE